MAYPASRPTSTPSTPAQPSLPAVDPAALTDDQLLGSGGETQVYALGAHYALRLYRGPIDPAYVERCRAFYDGLQAQTPPFGVPQILATGEIDGRAYTLERRLAGRNFGELLPELSGEARRRALYSYLAAALDIGALQVPASAMDPANAFYGEVLSPRPPVQAATWRDYLHARLDATLAMSYDDLAADVPHLDEILNRLRTALDWIDPVAPALVHGDYAPVNMLMDDEQNVTAVLDFGYATLHGDPRLDLAGALAFIELMPGYQAADSDHLRTALVEWLGGGVLPVLRTYRLYYAVYFSTTKADDPATYAWCVATLAAAARPH